MATKLPIAPLIQIGSCDNGSLVGILPTWQQLNVLGDEAVARGPDAGRMAHTTVSAIP